MMVARLGRIQGVVFGLGVVQGAPLLLKGPLFGMSCSCQRTSWPYRSGAGGARLLGACVVCDRISPVNVS